MVTIERELDRVLTLLRNKIRERGFTQLEVQEALGWGRSYISQLLTKQKSLRIEQVLLILNVIGVDAGEFFGGLYRFSTPTGGMSDYGRESVRSHRGELSGPGLTSEETLGLERNFEELQALLRGLLGLLTQRGLLEVDEILAAVESAGVGKGAGSE